MLLSLDQERGIHHLDNLHHEAIGSIFVPYILQVAINVPARIEIAPMLRPSLFDIDRAADVNLAIFRVANHINAAGHLTPSLSAYLRIASSMIAD